VLLVEASRRTPRDKRHKFLVSRTFGGDSLIHSSIPDDKRRIYYGDVEVLALQGLLTIGFGSRGSPNFDVSPLGYRYYEFLKESLGRPVERIEKTTRSLIDSAPFQARFPAAHSKWASAEELLWRSDTEENFTTIGHLCREALQEFADVLVTEKLLDAELPDKSKTVSRLKAVLNLAGTEAGEAYKFLLGSLTEYWGAANDLVQRQEHGAVKEGEELNWEDARRVVFATLIAMHEIHIAASK